MPCTSQACGIHKAVIDGISRSIAAHETELGIQLFEYYFTGVVATYFERDVSAAH